MRDEASETYEKKRERGRPAPPSPGVAAKQDASYSRAAFLRDLALASREIRERPQRAASSARRPIAD